MKHPEDGHHDDCHPVPETTVMAIGIEREMRHDVWSNGKRPRTAYNDMLVNVAKKFKYSEELQTDVVAQLASYNEVQVALSHNGISVAYCVPYKRKLNVFCLLCELLGLRF